MSLDQWFSIRDNWQCLQTFSVVTFEGVATDNKWVETKDAAKHPILHKTAPHLQQRMIQPEISTVPKLKNTALENSKHCRADLKVYKLAYKQKEKDH